MGIFTQPTKISPNKKYHPFFIVIRVFHPPNQKNHIPRCTTVSPWFKKTTPDLGGTSSIGKFHIKILVVLAGLAQGDLCVGKVGVNNILRGVALPPSLTVQFAPEKMVGLEDDPFLLGK